MAAIDALLAVIDVLERESSLEEAFISLVEIVRGIVRFDAIALNTATSGAPLVHCKHGAERLRHDVTAAVEAARDYFMGSAPFESYATLITNSELHWISLPLSNNGKEILGILTVASSAMLDEGSVAFLACFARHFARRLGEGRLRAEAEQEMKRASAVGSMLRAEQDARAEAEQEAKISAWVADLTELACGDLSRDVVNALKILAHGAADRIASGCVIHFQTDGDRLDRVAHVEERFETALDPALAPLVAAVMRAGRTFCALDRRRNGGPPEAVRARNELGADWLIAAPVEVRERVVGVLTLFGDAAKYRPLSGEAVLRLARGAAVALSKRSLYDDARAMVLERDRMLSTVSHDLKNPLGVILMSAAYLLRGLPANERRRTGRAQLEAIDRNARRMKRLVADLLDFDSISRGRLALTPKPVDPRALIETAVEDALPIAEAAGITLRRGSLTRLPSFVLADGERIIQVLSNLLTNSVKFTPRGGRITVRARWSSPNEVTFAVEDTGCGIAANELPHVFERHWQSAATGAARLGSGLGLAICKSLIELSGGRIWAKSRLGRGTTISFVLPVAPAPETHATDTR